VEVEVEEDSSEYCMSDEEKRKEAKKEEIWEEAAAEM
jgi:hypothetical protein